MICGVDITPDYEFYTDTYHGHMAEADLASALPDALADVEYRIWPEATIDDSTLVKCKMAVCSVAELVGDSSKRLTSFTAGKVSKTFSAPFSMTSEASVERYLGASGILKRGRWL